MPLNSGDWQSAPIVIRGWAYTLSILGMIVVALVGIAGLTQNEPIAEKIGGLLFVGLLFGTFFWQRKAIRRGAANAWVVQIILSALGLLAFPLGTLIHGYILSQWFKPEVKAWFGTR
ncbi:MAG TPA: hypothetical protein VF681_09535 [Abditibacteriaceae bacterium]